MAAETTHGLEQEDKATQALSVSDAMALAKSSLESVTVRLVGEVSEVSVKPGYKAAYFTVKDKAASLPCMMWNNRYRAQEVELVVGQLVELTGRFTLYAAKGRMNFDVFSISLAGEGDLRMKVANIAKKLRAEGLTDAARKRSLPELPERIGLVTSPRSAAVHDVLRTFRRRFPMAEILLAGVPVEGASAPSGIIEGIRTVAAAGAEVVLVVRGGGSFEDLMPFNDEALARAIAACPVPVVTGIGHEVDTSIADMVSDFRASTPTAAAEAVSPTEEGLQTLFSSRAAALEGSLTRRLEKTAAYLERISDKPLFKDPMMLFAPEAQWLDTTSDRLARALPGQFDKNRNMLENLRARMVFCGPLAVERSKTQLANRASRLEDLSPVKTLARGYSIVRDEEGAIMCDVQGIEEGDNVSITLSDGTLTCNVEEVSNEPPFKALGKRG